MRGGGRLHAELMQKLLVFLIGLVPVFAQNTSDQLALMNQIPSRMSQFVKDHEVPGIITLVADRQGVIHHSAVGYMDPQQEQPLKPDAIFWIASMTKPITATAVLMMKDEGKLAIDDPVEKYIPELGSLKTADGQPVQLTIRHLLTHTSGMGEATPEEAKAAKTLADLIPAFAKKPVAFKPGTEWKYCQSGINTLGRIVEIVSGQSFPDFLAARLFKPLGMVDTTFYLSPAQLPRLVTPVRKEGDHLETTALAFLFGASPVTRDRYPLANGGLFSTALDYSKFAQMILNGGKVREKRYISEESFRLMTTLQTGEIKTGFTPGNGWGLGWCVVRQPQGVSATLSPGSFGHGGAYGTQAWIDPTKGLAYILMIQRAGLPNSDDSAIRKSFQEAAVLSVK